MLATVFLKEVMACAEEVIGICFLFIAMVHILQLFSFNVSNVSYVASIAFNVAKLCSVTLLDEVEEAMKNSERSPIDRFNTLLFIEAHWYGDVHSCSKGVGRSAKEMLFTVLQ